MTITRSETLELLDESDVVRARQAAREWLSSLEFGLTAMTRVVTATSELARNTLDHGGGGSMMLEELDEPGRAGLRLTFRDDGPGIADIEQALTDGFTTGSGLGLGLGGSRRLMSDFAIDSTPGHGTTVVVVGWR
jgi:serine/threonine-protein kinase RsbT